MYNKINNKIIKLLSNIAGPENILSENKDLEPFSRDETPGACYFPEAVIKPTQINQVKEILKLANKENFPVIPRGGGTSLTGGSLAVFGGAVISFERLNKIIDLDTGNKICVVEPGVINGSMQKEAENLNMFYPVNPASMDSCTMGGNVAESTGGANTVKYGTTRNYLLGVHGFTGSGEEIKSGGKVIKNSTDQILFQLLCGSEGTLSIFTKLIFRLINKPLFTSWIIAPFKDIYKITEASLNVFKQNLQPTMIELMDSSTLKYTQQYLNTEIQYSQYPQLLVRIDSNNKKYLDELCFKLGDSLFGHGAVDVLMADTKIEQDKIWKIRSSVHDAIKELPKSMCEEDVVVPLNKVSDMIKKAYKLSENFSLPAVVFGHLGDGNIHLNFTNPQNNLKNIEKRISDLRKEIFKNVCNLGGKLSGEHGIGISKKPFFKRYIHSGYVNIFKKIKKQFDPNYILNPGKIIDL
ncbi:MAG: FAD-binding oxidoreductase [Elusimicrobiota bacterium]